MIDPMQTEQLVSRFDRDGYICVDPLLAPAEMSELNAEVDRFICDVVPQMPAAQVYYEDKNDKNSLKQLQKIFEYDGYFEDLMLNGPVRRVAEIVLRDAVVPINMQYFNKAAGNSKPTPPHQDGYYFHLTPCDAVTGWLALEDVDHENGCIHYVRVSHQTTDFRPHAQTGVLGFSQGMTDFGTETDRANTVAFPGKAGTLLMHHAKTIHWADANRSKSRSRRALGFIYYAERAKPDPAKQIAYQAALDAQLRAAERI